MLVVFYYLKCSALDFPISPEYKIGPELEFGIERNDGEKQFWVGKAKDFRGREPDGSVMYFVL